MSSRQERAARVQFRHERIALGAVRILSAEERLVGAGRHRKVDPLAKTGDVGAARRIDGHAAPFVPARASEVARIFQRRIDDERLRAIVVANREAHLPIRPKDERTDDVNALLADVLDRAWRRINQLSGAESDAKLSFVAEAERSGTFIPQPDARGVGTLLHTETRTSRPPRRR